MSDMVVVAMIAALPATIGAINASVAARLSRRNAEALAVVHAAVNSNLTAIKLELAIAHREIERLTKMLS